MAITDCMRSVIRAIARAGAIANVLMFCSLSGACALGSRSCTFTTASGSHFSLTTQGGRVSIAREDGDDYGHLTTIGLKAAGWGALVTNADEAHMMIVVGPRAMARVDVDGASAPRAPECDRAALAVAAIAVDYAATVTVKGLDNDSQVLFTYPEVTTDHSGVISQIRPD
jgi:hypothetical protein